MFEEWKCCQFSLKVENYMSQLKTERRTKQTERRTNQTERRTNQTECRTNQIVSHQTKRG